MTDRFPLTDRAGHPLGPDCFVTVDGPGLTERHRNRFRGLVTEVGCDRVGDLVYVREWRSGAFTGAVRVARPDHVRVRRGPRNLRDAQRAFAKRTAGTAQRRPR